jgi:hypothetical protein
MSRRVHDACQVAGDIEQRCVAVQHILKVMTMRFEKVTVVLEQSRAA